ncbi:MAG: DNA replication/repair protein RecF [Chloroflexota bacterium]
MHITHLSLTNFRNYRRLELSLAPGATLLHGQNAQGKTNLLEAIYYLATTRSPHADNDQQLISWEAEDPEEPVIVGRLVARVSTLDGPRELQMRLIKEQQRGQSSFRREALVDGRKVRLMDLLGNLQVALFLPEDVQIITGPPSRRRRYLDITLCQADRRYCRTLSAYNKNLEQRNALLRQIAETGSGRDLLPVYTGKLVELGSQVFARRAAFIASLAADAQRLHYEQLTEGKETLRLHYLPRLEAPLNGRNNHSALRPAVETGQWLQDQEQVEPVAQRFAANLAQSEKQDIASGSTQLGPHRDDWRFWTDGRNLSSYGSRGQQRTAMLALKLAEIHWMAAQSEDAPVLLLDEVVAELDERRRALLLETVQSVSQAVLTATDPGMFTAGFLQTAALLQVVGGRVTADDSTGKEAAAQEEAGEQVSSPS